MGGTQLYDVLDDENENPTRRKNNTKQNGRTVWETLYTVFTTAVIIALIVLSAIILHEVKQIDEDCADCVCNIMDCPIKYDWPAPNLHDLIEWTTADWNPTNEFVISEPSTRQYIYKSAAALPATATTVFGLDYHAHLDSPEYIPGTSPGVPGPFDYNLPYSGWGGDNVTVGQQYYGQILAHFGHTHILTIQQRSVRVFENHCANTESEDKMLEHLVSGSTQIFNWYAQIVDIDGNFNPPQGSFFGDLTINLFNQMINGAGTPNGNGHIDMAALSAGIQIYIDYAAVNFPSQVPLLGAEAARLMAFLTDVLDLDTMNPQPLISWNILMDVHQQGSVDSFYKYMDIYKSDPNAIDYESKVYAANQFILEQMKMGRQLGAFFGAFYSFTNFLDKFYAVNATGYETDDYAIPLDIMAANTDFVISAQKNYWYQHTVLFQDWHKANVLEDYDSAYKINVWFLESCANIATSVGEIFSRFDRLIRYRGLFTYLNSLPAPP